MANSLIRKTLISVRNPLLFKSASSRNCYISSIATAEQPQSDGPSLSFTFSSDGQQEHKADNNIYVKAPSSNPRRETASSSSSVTMPMSFMTGSIVGKRFHKQVTIREADDGNGWTVMLDYRTLKTPSKRPLKLPTSSLAKAIAAEWEYQQTDGIRPFTMPLMKLACTASERVPLTRPKIIEHLIKKFNQDLVFCRAPEDNDLTSNVYAVNVQAYVLFVYAWPEHEFLYGFWFWLKHFTGDLRCHLNFVEKQVEKIDPLLDWVASEFGFKPVVYSSFFGGKQEDGLVKAMENFLKRTDDCELAVVDAIASAAHSLVIAVGLFRGKLQIEEAIELIRLEEDLQVDRWGLVEGGHDVDIADLRVQISSAVVFLGLSRKM
ncbi:uncharacterized protein LOC107415236 isoform X1 [Ziziphus jujuba]|uniref:Uncharacterized protein LOC107415236 isoform X1 n=1 Tax=Ziziphus jujuba TaxID=326968 RepID=A0ABM4A829_ZIZJJ|nr:uncharacterized protein LOC107415236 isoform X1 [Ziziphus jujuba]